MSLIKKFNETGQEIGSENVAPDNFQQLVEQYGPEFAKGYAAAVTNLTNQLFDEVLMHPKRKLHRGYNYFNSRQIMGRLVYEFYSKKLLPLCKVAEPLSPEPFDPNHDYDTPNPT